MSSFQSFLHVGGKRYEILYSDLDIHQQIDSLGRPASPTFGGMFNVAINMPGGGDPTLFDWMFDPAKILSGKVVLKRIDTDATLKTIKFYNAYCVGMALDFDGTANASSFRLRLRISPEQFDVNGLFHDNHWPDESPIQGMADEDGPGEKQPGLLSDIAHGVLDVAGLVPVVGELADGANALFYLAEGNQTDAALSAAAMIPIAGWAATGAKAVRKGVKIAEKARRLKRAVAAARKTTQELAKGGRNVLKQVEGHIFETIPERSLSFGKVRFTHKAVSKVTDHLSRFGPFTANTKMLERLGGIANGATEATDIDKRFLTHELREMIRMRLSKAGVGEVNSNSFNEAAYRAAHDATLREYGLFVKEYDKLLYHPDAIKAGEIAGDWF